MTRPDVILPALTTEDQTFLSFLSGNSGTVKEVPGDFSARAS
jgi:hypothetical protein